MSGAKRRRFTFLRRQIEVLAPVTKREETSKIVFAVLYATNNNRRVPFRSSFCAPYKGTQQLTGTKDIESV